MIRIVMVRRFVVRPRGSSAADSLKSIARPCTSGPQVEFVALDRTFASRQRRAAALSDFSTDRADWSWENARRCGGDP